MLIFLSLCSRNQICCCYTSSCGSSWWFVLEHVSSWLAPVTWLSHTMESRKCPLKVTEFDFPSISNSRWFKGRLLHFPTDYVTFFIMTKNLLLRDLPAFLPDENAAYPTITAFQSATLRITFSFKKQPGKPQETTINATFTNLATTTFTDFVFQAAVPKVVFISDTCSHSRQRIF